MTAILAVRLAASLASAGVIAIGPDLGPQEQYSDVVRSRYKVRVERDRSDTLKYIMTARRLYNPACQKDCETYLLESNVYSYWVKFLEKACVHGQPADAGVTRFGHTGLWMSIPDYNKHGFIGVRQLDNPTKSMFPRQTIAIDPVQSISKIETITQMDVTKKDLQIEYSRGDTFTFPRQGWGWRFETDQGLNPEHATASACRQNLPEGPTYRCWNATVLIGYHPYKLEYVLPDEHARAFTPYEMMSITAAALEKSEAESARRAGDFVVYFWDLEFQREGDREWRPLTKLKLFRYEDPVGWGARLGRYRGRNVLQIDNDGRGPYFGPGESFDIGTPMPAGAPIKRR
ncbi:MAG: hypothetical protein HY925_09930 [Elusimicrobia bacterium]|nr:hypothetical protein [Elusimicrobiota bacterium]